MTDYELNGPWTGEVLKPAPAPAPAPRSPSVLQYCLAAVLLAMLAGASLGFIW
jgi:hypothetical protein